MSVDAIDFFCGCGGTSYGLKKAGINVLCGIDFDESCKETYESNLGLNRFLHADITKLSFATIEERLKHRRKNSRLLFSACAPCQPFSSRNKSKSEGDQRKSLLIVFSKFIEEFQPDFVFIENVPGLQKVDKGQVFKKFIKNLESMKYSFSYDVVNAKNYGVPQSRKRLILLASKNSNLEFPKVTHGAPNLLNPLLKPVVTVRDVIGNLPPVPAGGTHPELNGHSARSITEINMKRLKLTPHDGGDRRSWPRELVLDCHKGKSGHEDVYGRLFWDKPSPALTCNCTSISNGRYGHPVQNRAITPREAAYIQTFPPDYKFFGSIITMSKHIGNAVPVELASAFGKQIVAAAKSI
jgi:DNA (cytosine-5)-methyltransferase 1